MNNKSYPESRTANLQQGSAALQDLAVSRLMLDSHDKLFIYKEELLCVFEEVFFIQ